MSSFSLQKDFDDASNDPEGPSLESCGKTVEILEDVCRLLTVGCALLYKDTKTGYPRELIDSVDPAIYLRATEYARNCGIDGMFSTEFITCECFMETQGAKKIWPLFIPQAIMDIEGEFSGGYVDGPTIGMVHGDSYDFTSSAMPKHMKPDHLFDIEDDESKHAEHINRGRLLTEKLGEGIEGFLDAAAALISREVLQEPAPLNYAVIYNVFKDEFPIHCDVADLAPMREWMPAMIPDAIEAFLTDNGTTDGKVAIAQAYQDNKVILSM